MTTVCAAVICVSICVVVLYIAYIIQSARTHAREDAKDEKFNTEREQLEKELQDAKDSHNLARIALARRKLKRLLDKQ